VTRMRTLTILLPVAMAAAACGGSPEEPSESPVPATPSSTPSSESWLLLPEFPSTATQADVGAEIYRLVCQDCHGDRGQGLTDGWRAEWAPEDQNCWQSKCHASNHPPEGFILPRHVPALIGPNTLLAHQTVLDLQNFIRNRMPWHDPGNLQEVEYWQVTAYLIRERGLASGDLPLGEAEAANLPLHSNQATP